MGILNSGLPGGGEFAHQKISQWFKPGGRVKLGIDWYIDAREI